MLTSYLGPKAPFFLSSASSSSRSSWSIFAPLLGSLPWFLACVIVRDLYREWCLKRSSHTGRVASFLLSVTSSGSGVGSFSRLVSRSSWLAMERSSSVSGISLPSRCIIGSCFVTYWSRWPSESSPCPRGSGWPPSGPGW